LKDKLLFIPLWFLRNVAFRLSCETLIIILRNFYAGKTGCYIIGGVYYISLVKNVIRHVYYVGGISVKLYSNPKLGIPIYISVKLFSNPKLGSARGAYRDV